VCHLVDCHILSEIGIINLHIISRRIGAPLNMSTNFAVNHSDAISIRNMYFQRSKSIIVLTSLGDSIIKPSVRMLCLAQIDNASKSTGEDIANLLKFHTENLINLRLRMVVSSSKLSGIFAQRKFILNLIIQALGIVTNCLLFNIIKTHILCLTGKRRIEDMGKKLSFIYSSIATNAKEIIQVTIFSLSKNEQCIIKFIGRALDCTRKNLFQHICLLLSGRKRRCYGHGN